MAKDVKDHAEEARAYRDLFDIHLDCGRFSAAGEAAARERAVAEAAEDRIREAASCVRLAVALANGGDLVKSLALAEEALRPVGSCKRSTRHGQSFACSLEYPEAGREHGCSPGGERKAT